MVVGYYLILCICSTVCTWVYMFKWHRHFNVHFTLIYTIIHEQNENVFLLGNIGTPLFDEIDNLNKDSIVL